MNIEKPTLIIDKEKVKRNIERMANRVSASGSGIRFRPHFKTHRSSEVGEWFREAGITAIAVSSVEMAVFFAKHRWNDITIAIMVNPLQIRTIDELAGRVKLGVLVDSPQSIDFLEANLNHPVSVWIKIDTGYHRTGINWNNKELIMETINRIKESNNLNFSGLLTHSGMSYAVRSTDELRGIYLDTISKMNDIRDSFEKKGIRGIKISYGDTPTCSIMERFHGIDEIRCGNFVYYDVQQLYLGACKTEDIGAAVACPVIARYPERNELILYGGAVHLSKDTALHPDGRKIYGLVSLPQGNEWGEPLEETVVSSLSQEHGIVRTTEKIIKQVKVGDVLIVLPVHSCLVNTQESF